MVLIDKNGLVDELLHRIGRIQGSLWQFLHTPVQRAFPALFRTLAKGATLKVDRLAHWRQQSILILVATFLGRTIPALALNTGDARVQLIQSGNAYSSGAILRLIL